MKKGGNKLFLVAGVALAAVAIVLLGTSVMNSKGKADTTQQTKTTKVTVVEAAVDIPAHQLLTPEDLIEVQVPETEAAPDAVRSKNEVVGLAYRVPLVKGQRLLLSQTEQPGLRNDIQAGKRAVAVPVNQVNLLSGLIQDGDFVDVIFDARINLVRLLPTNLAITPEDKTSYEFESGSGSSSSDSSGSDSSSSDNEGQQNQQSQQSGTSSIGWIPPQVDLPNHPFTGDPGSQFVIRDDVGENQQLEPVAKILVQDARVLRVVRPGETFTAAGTRAETVSSDVGVAPSNADQPGYLILEVTPEQAEVLAFVDDPHHQIRVIVRGKDDHATVSTTGITFQILATDPDWALPWPQSLTAPKQQSNGKSQASGSAATPAATPENKND